MPPETFAAVTLPPVPGGVWGSVLRWAARMVLLPAFRALLDSWERELGGQVTEPEDKPRRVRVPLLRR